MPIRKTTRMSAHSHTVRLKPRILISTSVVFWAMKITAMMRMMIAITPRAEMRLLSVAALPNSLMVHPSFASRRMPAVPNALDEGSTRQDRAAGGPVTTPTGRNLEPAASRNPITAASRNPITAASRSWTTEASRSARGPCAPAGPAPRSSPSGTRVSTPPRASPTRGRAHPARVRSPLRSAR